MQSQSTISPNLLAAFLAAPTPRHTVPPEIRRAALRQAAPLLVALVGGFVTCFALSFVWIFTPWNLLQDLRLEDAPTIAGRVESVTEANMSINKVNVMRYVFSFQPPSFPRQQGICFTTGRRWNEGDNITVRYLRETPEISRIEGARRSEGSPFLLFVWLFPGLGVGLVSWVLTSRRRMKTLLEQGVVSEGLVTRVERTNTQINRQYVYAITIERPGGSPLVIRRYHSHILAFARERLESKQPVFVLSDPANPKRALLPETL